LIDLGLKRGIRVTRYRVAAAATAAVARRAGANAFKGDEVVTPVGRAFAFTLINGRCMIAKHVSGVYGAG